MNTSTPFYILSGCTGGEDDTRRTLSLMGTLDALALSYKRVVGAYRGENEQSFVIVDTDVATHTIPIIAAEYEQESIMHVDANRHAMLGTLRADGIRWESLGRWGEISPRDAAEHDAYTFDPDTGKYFIAA